MAWQDIRQVVLERADLAVVTATVQGGKTRSVPVRTKKKTPTQGWGRED